MITDDEVMRVLEQANPASVDDPIPMLDIAGYREVLDASHITMTLIDSEQKPTESSSGRRWMILIAAAAAVVVAIAVAATRYEYVTPADQPSPTVTGPATTPPPALLGDTSRQLSPGTYFVDEVSGIPTPRIFVTIGAGWAYNPRGSVLSKFGDNDPWSDAGWIAFSRPGRVFSDACHWEDGVYPGPLATLDGVVAALSEQGGWAEVTAPSDISIDGYAGKAFQRTVPDISACDIDRGHGPRLKRWGQHTFRSWDSSIGSLYEPGMIETVWVLDIDGTAVVIHTMPLPQPSAGADVEFAAVLDSIRIDQA